MYNEQVHLNGNSILLKGRIYSVIELHNIIKHKGKKMISVCTMVFLGSFDF